MQLSKVKPEVDTHTHTLLSGHAWSTIDENAAAAAKNGVKAMCLTEHGPAMVNGPPFFITSILKFLPDERCGVHIIKGLEYNIMDFDGELDIEPSYRQFVNFGIASLHDVVIHPGTQQQHTQALIGALQHKTVDILGHPGTPIYTCDIEAVVLEAKRLDKLIEINNNSFAARQGGKVNCAIFALMCKKHDVRICVSSDAHYCQMIGNVPLALTMLEELAFPQELICNLYYDRFMGYLHERKNRFESVPVLE